MGRHSVTVSSFSASAIRAVCLYYYSGVSSINTNSLFLPAHRIPQGSRHKAADRQSACNNTAKILCHSGRSCKCSYKADHCDHGMADEPQGIDACNNIFHQPDIQTAKNQWNHITSSAHHKVEIHPGTSKPRAIPYFRKRRERTTAISSQQNSTAAIVVHRITLCFSFMILSPFLPSSSKFPSDFHMLFVRTHTSYIVNMEYIRAVRETETELQNGEHIPVSRKYRASVRAEHLKYMKWRTMQ